MNHSQRLHSLDSLRALMMWLGIVLHVSMQHLSGVTFLPWRDRETTPVADFLFIFIHCFRMPVFFILAGFFVAMLADRRGHTGMLKHRLRRIGLPFIVCWPFVFAGTIAMVVLYFNVMKKGTFTLDAGVVPAPAANGPALINPLHMWFLYYLMLFCLLAWFSGQLANCLPEGLKEGISGIWRSLASQWWGLILLAIPLALVSPFNKEIIDTSGISFVPQFDLLLHNGLFFAFGCYLYRHREELLAQYSGNCRLYLMAGLLFFILIFGMRELNRMHPAQVPHGKFLFALGYNIAAWFWSIGLIGFFLQHFPAKNRLLGYLSDSSYWAYLVHMMGTIGFGALLYDASFDALTKMGLNILATTLACITTYHLLVRYTPLGTLLNGARYSFRTGRKPADGSLAPK